MSRVTPYPHLAQRLFNTPLALLPAKAEVVMAVLADHFGVTKLFRADARVEVIERWNEIDSEPAPPRSYDVVAGVAIIPVTGTLVHKLGTLRPYSGMTGYDGIRANVSLALADPTVRAVVLDIDSPGGEIAGCLDLADALYAARGEKPLWAVLSEVAYSAGYALASACDHVVVPRTGGTGSVGVICLHADLSRALDSAGVTVTLITYGARKADAHEAMPLSREALARLQADVDAMGDLFVTTVARHRGLSFEAVRATQAATFLGAQGVDVGFADAVMAPDEAFRALLAELG